MKAFTSLELKWGIIFIIAALLWMVYEKMMGWHDVNIAQHASMTMLFMIPAITIYVVALIEKRRKHYANVMTWKQGFMSGLMITLVVVVISPLTQYITNTIITPDYFQNAIEYSVTELGKDRTQMEADFNLKSYIMQALFGGLAMGIVTSAVVAFFVKKGPSEAQNQ